MSAQDTRVVAILPLAGTTVTASRVPGVTGIAVIDGSTTLTVRHPGVTLAGGQVVVLGFAGIYDAETTGLFETLTGDQTPTIVQPVYPTAVGATAAETPAPITTDASKSSSGAASASMRTTSKPHAEASSSVVVESSSTTTSVVGSSSSASSSSASASSTTSAQGAGAVCVSSRWMLVAGLLMTALVGIGA